MVQDDQHRRCATQRSGDVERNYSGPFVTKAKAEYSNSKNANMQKWSSYITGDPKRQEILEGSPGVGLVRPRASVSTPTWRSIAVTPRSPA